MEVRLQQVDDREIGRRLPVGGRAADKDQRVPEAVRCDELPEETRLADAGLAYHGHDLTGICPRLLERSGELLELRAPGHEGRELFAYPEPCSLEAYKPLDPSHRSIAACAGRACTASFEDRERRLAT